MLCALAILAAGFPPVELELAGGAAHTLEGNYTSHEYPFLKPALQARVAVDFLSQLSLGASFLAVIGGEAPNRVACCLYDSGNQAFSATAALASLRYRFSGTPQFWGEGGLGTGHLISLQTESAFEHAPLRGHAGFCARLAAGLRWPVALTCAAWGRCVAVPPGVECQDKAGRLWDVLWLLACAVRRSGGGPELRFGVHVRDDNRERTPPLVRLKAVCGPGDQGAPVRGGRPLRHHQRLHQERPRFGPRRRAVLVDPDVGGG